MWWRKRDLQRCEGGREIRDKEWEGEEERDVLSLCSGFGRDK